MSRLGRVIKLRRQMLGLSQAALAKAMGGKPDQTTLSRYEKGKLTPRRSTLERLSKHLETPIEVFYEAMDPGQSGGVDEGFLADLADRLVRGSEFAGAKVQRWILNEIENALIGAEIELEDHPDLFRELRKELTQE